MKRRKIFTLCLAVLFCFAALGGASAKFRGGSIRDTVNRIKQAVETAKQSEMALQYKEITESYKVFSKEWDKLGESLSGLWKDVDKGILKKPYSALLGGSGDWKKELRKRQQFDLAGDGNTPKGREKNRKRLLSAHEEEMENAVSAASDNSEIAEISLTKALSVADSLPDADGNLGIRQRIALLSYAEAIGTNAETGALLQNSITGSSVRLMRNNLETESALFAQANAFYLPDAEDVVLKHNVAETRMEELPR